MEPRAVLTVDDIDLSATEFWARPWDEREGAFQTLRRERPMPFYEEPQIPEALSYVIPKGRGYYALTRHAHIAEASRHPEIFQSGRGATSIVDMPEEMLDFFGSMINMDNPRHARLRRIVSAAFNPRMIKSIEDRIELVADDVIDRVAERGACDFVVEVAARLPLEIICDMMGIAAADYDTVFNASNVILSAGDPEYVTPGEDPMVAFMNAAQQLNMLMTDLAAHRREHPTDDVTSALVNTNVDGEALTDTEIAAFFILLVVAGNETTRNAISHGLLAMTTYPEQRALWQADPAGIAATGVDEIVRWASPVIWMRRTVAADSVLGDIELVEGDKVIMFYNSANRDEDVFGDPFTFDVRRNPNPHIGFGAAGPHFCLGAHLARQEIDVMFRHLFERLPDIEAVGEPDRLLSPFINGIKHLDCRFTPVPPLGRRPAGAGAAAAPVLLIGRQGARAPDQARAAVHGDGDPDHLGDLLRGGAEAGQVPAVGGNAPVAFARDGDGQGDELLGLDVERPLDERGVVERAVARHDVGYGRRQRVVRVAEVGLNLMEVCLCHGQCWHAGALRLGPAALFGPLLRTSSTADMASRSSRIHSASCWATRRTHQARASLRLRATPASINVSSA